MHMSGNKRGFTLVEVMVAVAVLAIFAVIVYSTMIGTMRVVALEDTVLTMDQQANRALQEAAVQLRTAILPYKPNQQTLAQSVSGGTFELLDNSANGFGGNNGTAWRAALQDGVDSLAFLVPVDAQNDGDYLDDANHFEVGQARPGAPGPSLSCTFGGPGFRLDSTGPISALTVVTPAGLNSPAVENDANFVFANNTAISGGAAWPQITAFTVIRYIPELAGGVPVVIRESDIRGDGSNVAVDLDGNGVTTDQYNIGRLQVVYTGGTLAVLPDGPAGTTPVITNNVAQQQVDITGPIVLRKVDAGGNPAGGDDSIFRLGSPGNEGTFRSGRGDTALRVKLLLYDRNAQTGKPLVFNRTTPAVARSYEAVITLRNMVR